MAREDVLPALQLAAQAYGTNFKVLDNIAGMESSYDVDVVNDWDINAKRGTPSAGLMQFIEPTFNSFARQARAANPTAWRGVPMDWRNPTAQALAASWAIANGKGGHWATFDRAKAAAGVKSAKGPKGSVAATPGAPARTYGLQEAGPSAITNLLDDGSFLKGYMSRRASDPVPTLQSPAPARAGVGRGTPTSGGVPPRRPGETGQQYLDRVLMARFGLRHDPGNAQTTGGKHKGRGHYDGRATDFGDALNDPAVLQEAEDWVDANADALGVRLSWYGSDDDPSGAHNNHAHFESIRSLRGTKKNKTRGLR